MDVNLDFITEDDILTDYRGSDKKVVIPEGIEGIDDGVFYKRADIESVVIPEGVVSIGNSAFFKCTSLTEINIPESVAIIESSAFYGCTGLKKIYIPAKVAMIDWRVFTKCTGLERIDVSEDNADYSSVDGVMFTKGGNVLRYYPAGRPGDEYTVPEGVLNISIFSFKSCHTLKYLTIPESVETIDPGVFDENTEITLRVKKHSPAYKYALEYNINFELV